MKKIMGCICLILAIVIQASGLTVFADDNAWNIKYEGDYKTDRDTYYAEISTSRAFDGNRSLYVKYPNAAVENTYLLAENTLSESVSAGEYKFSICYRGKMPTASISLIMGQTEILFSDSSFGAAESVVGDSGETGWKRLSAVINYMGENIETIGLKFVGNVSGLYLDNVSLVHDDNEYVSSGGFELIKPPGPAVDTPIDKYAPQSLIGESSENIVKLSWKNPVCGTVTKVELYESINGEDVLLENSFTKGANEVQTWKSAALVEDDMHIYKIVYSYSDRDSIEFVKSVRVRANANHLTEALGGWDRMNNGEGEIAYDSTESYSGKSSLHVRANWDTIEGGRYIGFRKLNLSFAANTEYEISFRVKSKICAHMLVEIDWNPDVFTTSGTFNNLETNNEWTEVKLVRKASQKGTAYSQFLMIFDGMTDAWFDDFSIKPILEDGAYGDEMVTNGDFEMASEEPEANKITDISTYGYNNLVNLEWKAPNNCNRVNVYRGADGIWTKIADLDADVNFLKLNKMESDTTYSFKICPVNSSNTESEGTIVEVKTILPNYIINEPVLNLQTDGKYNVVCGVKNYKYSEGMNIEILAGVYEGEKLIKLYSGKNVIPVMDKYSKPKTVTVSGVELPKGETYCVRVFFIDSRDQRNALYPMVNLTGINNNQ